ncbi:MAG: hypothetical protein A3F67_09690 [Verrucomicrobia bacterium RIFCSPHIGHO2_12_FULL_41_10]|nr:MAG: hypothetical protein A3F67_09690 [Verrucomicrobia bacterium RIFCSPHIGHO2_12_FULL_41_10]
MKMNNTPKTLPRIFPILAISFLFINSSSLFAQMNRAGQELGGFLEETFQVEEGDAAAAIGVLPVRDQINIHPVENNCFHDADEKWNAYHEKLDNSNGRKVTSNASNTHDPEIESAFQNAEKAEKEALTNFYKKVLNYCEISQQTQEVLFIREYLTDLYGETQKKAQEAQNLHSCSTEAVNNFVAPVLKASSSSCTLNFCAPSTPCSSSASATMNTSSQHIALDRMRKPTMNAVKAERYRAIAKTYNDVFRAMLIEDFD